MVRYTVKVTNSSSVAQHFLLFQGLPDKTQGPQGNRFRNVFMSSRTIEGTADDSVTFNLVPDYYAIYGSKTSPDSDGSAMESISARPVQLGPHGSWKTITTDSDGESPMWGKQDDKDKTTEAAGEFTIETSPQFVADKGIYVGIGARSPLTGKVVPISTFIAHPATTYQVQPVPKYYIVSGNFMNGELATGAEFGKVLVVDFSKATGNHPTAEFTLGQDQLYTADDAVQLEQQHITFANDS